MKEVTRIYVGGLGATVTEDDLHKTFSALGQVVTVDVVRTKDRSFAYLDFLPSSDKSLPKLFSTYNGCMWKGGKLRLEKAKEHYLIRLKREWQEEAERANKALNTCIADPSESHDALEKPKKPSSTEKTQLCLFFPKLQKVKSLASVGIGKHKYSFQRIQVPSIPTLFCDCEEHERPFLTTNKKQSTAFEDADSGVNEQELNIMNSVMNKIFERENPSKQVNERGISMKSDDEEDHLTDEDNLIINVASGKSDDVDLLGEMRSMMANREPVAKRLKSSSEKTKKVQDSQKKKLAPPTKKRKALRLEEKGDNNPVIPKTARNSKTNSNPRNTEVESSTKQLGINSLRSLKSTWKDLIGQKGNTPFSISDIIATVPQEKQEDIDLPLTKTIQNTPKKSSAPETTSSTLHINKEATTEISWPTEEISLPDMVLNDFEQNGKEPKTDVDKDVEKHNEDLIRTARGDSWRHKSSWTQLVSNTGNTQFSISQVVPNLSFSFDKHRQQDDSLDLQPENRNLDERMFSEKSNEVVASSPVEKNASEQKRVLSLGNLESDDRCPFMRTEESMKEWKKAKASLNKKKRSADTK